MASYNILSLDGGGTWALLQVRALQALYGADARGHDVLRNFRLVVANSGGSIVAAGLWRNLPLSELAQYFLNERFRKSIFAPLPIYRLSRFWNLLGIGPRYSAEAKLAGLEEMLGEGDVPGVSGLSLRGTMLSKLPRFFGREDGLSTDLVVIAFDYDRCRAEFLRTNQGSKAGSSLKRVPTSKGVKDTTLARAIHASSHAPVNYFSDTAVIEFSDGRKVNAWDGAIGGYNNPILAGITEALANEGHRSGFRSEIRVLSIGTGTVMLPTGGPDTGGEDWLLSKSTPGSLFTDVQKLATSILANPPDVATYMAYLMLDGKLPLDEDPLDAPARRGGPIVRMNPMIQPLVRRAGRDGGHFDFVPPRIDEQTAFSQAEFTALVGLGLDAVEPKDVELIDKLARAWAGPGELVHNQPILARSVNLACELGHRWFSGAHRRAVELGFTAATSPKSVV